MVVVSSSSSLDIPSGACPPAMPACCDVSPPPEAELAEAATADPAQDPKSAGKSVEWMIAAVKEETDPIPELNVRRSLSGLQEANRQGGKLLNDAEECRRAGDHDGANAALEESARWATKLLWVEGSGEISGVDDGKRGAWYCNRAFAFFELGRWNEVEADCSAAITLKSKSKEPRYMRAKARYILALDGSQNIERWMLAKGASEDIQAEFGEYGEHPEEPRWEKLKGKIEELKEELIGERREAGEPFPEIGVERSVRGLRWAMGRGNYFLCKGRSVAWTVGGHWEASAKAGSAYNHFSKAIWVAGQMSGVPDELRSQLLLCRAGAGGTLGKWAEVESDCSEVLALSGGQSAKAQYRRAQARYHLSRIVGSEGLEEAAKALLLEESKAKAAAGLLDIQQVLREASPESVEAREGDAETIRANLEAMSRGEPPVRHC